MYINKVSGCPVYENVKDLLECEIVFLSEDENHYYVVPKPT